MIGRRVGFSLGSRGLLSWKYQNFWGKYEEKILRIRGKAFAL
jgi:hypothetical protein